MAVEIRGHDPGRWACCCESYDRAVKPIRLRVRTAETRSSHPADSNPLVFEAPEKHIGMLKVPPLRGLEDLAAMSLVSLSKLGILDGASIEAPAQTNSTSSPLRPASTSSRGTSTSPNHTHGNLQGGVKPADAIHGRQGTLACKCDSFVVPGWRSGAIL